MNSAASSPIARTVVTIAALGSIATLLGQLYALAPMSVLARFCLVPTMLVIVSVWFIARRGTDADLMARIRAGWIGGIWGTLGYDWGRVPMHALGQNPFAPIRSYGVWIAGAAQSTPLTDLLGVLYHFSNGITFGLIFAMVAMRWNWLTAIVWGLLLETLAVATPFGEVFAVRYAPAALVIAYVAHIFYGAPLGWVCRRVAGNSSRPFGHASLWLMTALTLAFCAWFITAWQPLRGAPQLAVGEIQVGNDALYPGWSDYAAGEELTVVSRMADSCEVRYRHSSAPGVPGRVLALPPHGTVRVRLDEPGVYQFLAPGRPWRSVFVSMRRGNDYRP